jgi:hypothetical protein
VSVTHPLGRFITLVGGGRKPFPILKPISNPCDARRCFSRGQMFRDKLTLDGIRERPPYSARYAPKIEGGIRMFEISRRDLVLSATCAYAAFGLT